MVTTVFRNVTLSASVTANAGETGIGPVYGPRPRVRAGKVASRDKRAARNAKRSFLLSC